MIWVASMDFVKFLKNVDISQGLAKKNIQAKASDKIIPADITFLVCPPLAISGNR